jgi:hypothetical protein
MWCGKVKAHNQTFVIVSMPFNPCPFTQWANTTFLNEDPLISLNAETNRKHYKYWEIQFPFACKARQAVWNLEQTKYASPLFPSLLKSWNIGPTIPYLTAPSGPSVNCSILPYKQNPQLTYYALFHSFYWMWQHQPGKFWLRSEIASPVPTSGPEMASLGFPEVAPPHFRFPVWGESNSYFEEWLVGQFHGLKFL